MQAQVQKVNGSKVDGVESKCIESKWSVNVLKVNVVKVNGLKVDVVESECIESKWIERGCC